MSNLSTSQALARLDQIDDPQVHELIDNYVRSTAKVDTIRYEGGCLHSPYDYGMKLIVDAVSEHDDELAQALSILDMQDLKGVFGRHHSTTPKPKSDLNKFLDEKVIFYCC